MTSNSVLSSAAGAAAAAAGAAATATGSGGGNAELFLKRLDKLGQFPVRLGSLPLRQDLLLFQKPLCFSSIMLCFEFKFAVIKRMDWGAPFMRFFFSAIALRATAKPRILALRH
jgi:hypothetical protein